ncbi:MAG: response regulator [Patescibacteria group bacterium]
MLDKQETILIVEDEITLNELICKKFESDGFLMLEAKNGEEGLKIALSSRPDIILLDIVMPVMDGITMLEKLREDEWGKNAKVIMLTNLNDSERVATAMTRGSYDYLVKCDWTIEDIVKKVREKLRS